MFDSNRKNIPLGYQRNRESWKTVFNVITPFLCYKDIQCFLLLFTKQHKFTFKFNSKWQDLPKKNLEKNCLNLTFTANAKKKIGACLAVKSKAFFVLFANVLTKKEAKSVLIHCFA
jgi:hypothetical protein